MDFIKANTQKEFELAKSLFIEYASLLEVDLSFQGFNDELNLLQIQYTHPGGALFIALSDQGSPIGCFGIRRIEQHICELKRMYLKESFRGMGIGDQMVRLAINTASDLGYSFIRLDTLPSMKSATHLYIKHGFYEIPPYRFNPVVGTKYLEMKLNDL